jgi:transcriptional regulator with XRE-family HTH domain
MASKSTFIVSEFGFSEVKCVKPKSNFLVRAYLIAFSYNMQAQSLSRIPLDYLLGMTIGRPPKSKRSAFGQRLQLLREKARLSQREVAAALGITQPSYVKWERRDIGLTVDQLKKLASILGVPVEEFFSTDDQPKRNGPVGRARKTFDALAELPRRRQMQILDVVEALVSTPRNGKGS